MTTKQAELYRSVIGRLILEFLSDKSVEDTLDLPRSHSQTYLPILTSDTASSEVEPLMFKVEGVERDVLPRIRSLLTVLKAFARCYSFFAKQESLFAGFGRLYITNNGRLFRDFLDLLEVSMKQGEKDLSDLSHVAQEAQEVARNQWLSTSKASARLKNYQLALSHSQELRRRVPSGQGLVQALRKDLTNTGSYPEVMAEMKGRIVDLMDLHKFTMEHFNGWLGFSPSESGLLSISAGEPASQPPPIQTASWSPALQSIASFSAALCGGAKCLCVGSSCQLALGFPASFPAKIIDVATKNHRHRMLYFRLFSGPAKPKEAVWIAEYNQGFTEDPVDLVQDAFSMLPANVHSRLPELRPQFRSLFSQGIALCIGLSVGSDISRSIGPSGAFHVSATSFVKLFLHPCVRKGQAQDCSRRPAQSRQDESNQHAPDG